MAVWPNNYRTASGWNPYTHYGLKFLSAYKEPSSKRLSVFINENIPSTYQTPTGYYRPAWIVQPVTAGGISTYKLVTGEGDITNANAIMVVLASAAVTGSGDITDAAASLIVQLAAALVGSGDITDADLKAFLAAAAALTGTGSISSASLTGLGELLSALSGTGSLTAASSAIGELSADIVSYGTLTVEGMRDAVWNALYAQYNDPGTMGEIMNNMGAVSDPWSVTLPGTYTSGQAGNILGNILTNLPNAVWSQNVEGGTTALQILRLLSAIAAGKTTIVDNGNGTATITFRDINDTTNRVVASMDGSERVTVNKSL